LTVVEKRLLDKTIQGFERSGLALEPEQRKRMKVIKERMSNIAIQFEQNVAEENTKVILSKEELEGMTDDFFESLTKDSDGKYLVSLQYPHFFPILKQCKVAETRRKMEFAYSSTASRKTFLSLTRYWNFEKKRLIYWDSSTMLTSQSKWQRMLKPFSNSYPS